jgi:hypothetical protein
MEMSELPKELEAAAEQFAAITGYDIGSAREAVAINMGLIPGCVIEVTDEEARRLQADQAETAGE